MTERFYLSETEKGGERTECSLYLSLLQFKWEHVNWNKKGFLFYLFILKIFIFTLFYFTILYWFCHTLTWIVIISLFIAGEVSLSLVVAGAIQSDLPQFTPHSRICPSRLGTCPTVQPAEVLPSSSQFYLHKCSSSSFFFLSF